MRGDVGTQWCYVVNASLKVEDLRLNERQKMQAGSVKANVLFLGAVKRKTRSNKSDWRVDGGSGRSMYSDVHSPLPVSRRRNISGDQRGVKS